MSKYTSARLDKCEEEVVLNQMNELAVKDSAGNSDGSSASSGTYYVLCN